jgi:hypothetical protein
MPAADASQSEKGRGYAERKENIPKVFHVERNVTFAMSIHTTLGRKLFF